MNTCYALLFVVLVAGVSGASDLQERSDGTIRSLTIRRIIENLRRDIRERGLDPYHQKGVSHKISLVENSDVATVILILGDILFEGLSNIKIDSVDLSVLLSRLRLHLSWPLMYGEIGHSEATLKLLGKEVGGKMGGSIAIAETSISLDVRVNIGILGGITVRNIAVNFNIANIESDILIKIFGHDFSKPVNTFVGITIPELLKEHSTDINKFLEQIFKHAIENS